MIDTLDIRTARLHVLFVTHFRVSAGFFFDRSTLVRDPRALLRRLPWTLRTMTLVTKNDKVHIAAAEWSRWEVDHMPRLQSSSPTDASSFIQQHLALLKGVHIIDPTGDIRPSADAIRVARQVYTPKTIKKLLSTLPSRIQIELFVGPALLTASTLTLYIFGRHAHEYIRHAMSLFFRRKPQVSQPDRRALYIAIVTVLVGMTLSGLTLSQWKRLNPPVPDIIPIHTGPPPRNILDVRPGPSSSLPPRRFFPFIFSSDDIGIMTGFGMVMIHVYGQWSSAWNIAKHGIWDGLLFAWEYLKDNAELLQ